MPSQEQITDQQELLQTYRRTLAHYLKQLAAQTEAFVPPGIAHGIREARENVQRIKDILRQWEIPIEDHPDDTSPSDSQERASLGGQGIRRHIFISYKRDVEPDEPLGLELHQALSLHHKVFIDKTMPPGTRWVEHIETELHQSDFLIVLLSERSIHSEMLKGEVEKASKIASIHGGRPTILPVRLAYREPFQYPLSIYLNHINWAFWRNSTDTPRVIQELLTAIAGGSLPIGEQWKQQLINSKSPERVPRPRDFAQPQFFKAPSGTVDLDSNFYIERAEADPFAQRAIQRGGETITIKGPRQMGKSSLLIRAMRTARSLDKQCVFLDFQLIDQDTLTKSDLFFREFAALLTQKLGLQSRIDDFWSSPLSNKQRCTDYMELYLLQEVKKPIVLCMDEVESIFDTGFRTDFFSMLRNWHNNRAIDPIWKLLDLVLVTSTEPYQLIDDLNQSPFNVGEIIELQDFSIRQVAELNLRYGSPLDLEGVQRLMRLLNGHPYLSRMALYFLASNRISLKQLFAKATDDRGPFGDHLRNHLFRLHTKPELVQGLRQVLRNNTCTDDTIFFRLRGAGLIQRSNDRSVIMRCQLYADYFQEHLYG